VPFVVPVIVGRDAADVFQMRLVVCCSGQLQLAVHCDVLALPTGGSSKEAVGQRLVKLIH